MESDCVAKKFTYKEVKHFVEVQSNSGCELVSKEYKNSREKIDIKCSCGEIFMTTFYEFKNKSRHQCKKCGYRNGAIIRTKTQDEFIKEVHELVSDEYVVIGKYTKDREKIKMKHSSCGHTWSVSPSNFLQGSRCPKCQHQSYRKTHEEFISEVYDLHGDEYEVLDKYTAAHKQIKVRHNDCSTIFKVKASTILNKNCSCPNCRSISRGEERIAIWLKENNITNIPEYTFDDCKYKKSLPFDFAIFNNNKSLLLLLEYDGEQHYTGWRGAENSLKNIQRNDKIKNEYCKNNNIKLIRIPYWDFSNLEEVLEQKLLEVINIEKEDVF